MIYEFFIEVFFMILYVCPLILTKYNPGFQLSVLMIMLLSMLLE